MKKTASDVIKKLIKAGIFASVSDIIDYDTAALIAMEMGCKVEREVVVSVEDRLIDDHEDAEEDLVPARQLWLSWAMLTTAKQAFSTISAMRMSPPASRRHHAGYRRLHCGDRR